MTSSVNKYKKKKKVMNKYIFKNFTNIHMIKRFIMYMVGWDYQN